MVVDCGSLDGTAAVARSFTERVVSCPWTDDFAAARNRALAEADTPWALTLDADERLVSADPTTVETVLRTVDLDGVTLPVLFYGGPHLVELARQPRLFRRAGAGYRGKVAETLQISPSRWSFFPRPDLLEINNLGHFGPGLQQRGSLLKIQPLLEAELENTEDPERRLQLVLRLGGVWLRGGSFPQAAGCFHALSQEPHLPADALLPTLLGLLEALTGLEQFADAVDLADHILAKDAGLKVAWGRRAYALNRLERSREARESILRGIGARHCLSWSGGEDARITQELWFDLGVTLSRLGEHAGAVYAFMKLKAEAPGWSGPVPVERMVFRALVEGGAIAEAKLLLGELAGRDAGVRAALLEDLSQLGHPELALDLLVGSENAPETVPR